MTPLVENRAVIALFRVWGGVELPLRGDARRRLAGRGAHRGEVVILAVAVSVVVAAMVSERLTSWLGPWWAAALALPAFAAAMHLGGVVLGMVARPLLCLGGERDAWIWRCWAAALSVWAFWAWGAGGWIRWVALGWLLLVACNVASVILLGWRRLMRVSGRRGAALRVVLAVALHLAVVPLALVAGWWALGWWALLGGGWAAVTFIPNATGFGPIVSRCDGSGVWLTIDDGPDPQTTPRLLELLDRYRAKATFFLVGERAGRHPELVREIVARGHEAGNHTGTHPRATFWAAGPGRTAEEIRSGRRAIEAATGERCRWFRAPVGHCNYFTHPFASEDGLTVIGWTRRGFDGVSTDVDAIVRRLTKGARGGDILVMHDATPVAVEVLGGVLEKLEEAGLRCDLPEDTR